MSRPVWGAWIEMDIKRWAAAADARRAPYGARGLKYRQEVQEKAQRQASRPVWGAWIEIAHHKKWEGLSPSVAPRMGRVD